MPAHANTPHSILPHVEEHNNTFFSSSPRMRYARGAYTDRPRCSLCLFLYLWIWSVQHGTGVERKRRQNYAPTKDCTKSTALHLCSIPVTAQHLSRPKRTYRTHECSREKLEKGKRGRNRTQHEDLCSTRDCPQKRSHSRDSKHVHRVTTKLRPTPATLHSNSKINPILAHPFFSIHRTNNPRLRNLASATGRKKINCIASCTPTAIVAVHGAIKPFLSC